MDIDSEHDTISDIIADNLTMTIQDGMITSHSVTDDGITSHSVTDDMFTSNNNKEISKEYISWLIKYNPTNFDDCFLNPEDKNKIEQWIKALLNYSSKDGGDTKSKKKKKKKDIPSNCLFLHGPPGIGKTTMASLLLKKYNYDILEYNASDARTAKIIQDKLNKVGGSHNIVDFMCNKKTKIAVILDEIDGLSSGDKGGLSEINSIIGDSKENQTPFICISNNICKKMDSLKRKSIYLKIGKPSDFTLKKLINRVIKAESIVIDDIVSKKIVAKSQGDIRRCLTMLEYLFRNKSIYVTDPTDDNTNLTGIKANMNATRQVETLRELKKKTKDETGKLVLDLSKEQETESKNVTILDEIESYSRKNTELAPYEMCEKILNSYSNLEFFLENFNYDHSMTNWYLYENFIKYIDKNRIGSFEKKVNSINSIFNYFSNGDIIEKKMILKQNYDLYEYINILKTYSSAFWTNKELKKCSYNKMGMMNYSTLLNKTSLEYFNSKNWGLINNKLRCKQNTNITTSLCDIIFKRFDANDTKFIRDVIEEYSLSEDELEKIIKSSLYYNKELHSGMIKKNASKIF